MSGHSKWSTIKHKKAKTDAQRGKQFSKVAKEIVMAAKLGGGDPDQNPRLRLALQKAKQVNMPNENVKRAVQKGAGGGDESALEEVTYEAFASHGVALLIEALTDNRHRTVANIKSILGKGGANMATPGAVSYLFEKKGLFLFEPEVDADKVIDQATELGAEDVDLKDDDSIEVLTGTTEFESVKDGFDSAELVYQSAEITMIPSTTIVLSEEDGEKIIALLEKIEEDDDVQDVYANFDIN
ncbi:YebC/PmpR family DNA-binding transcriptional regulator [Candidatus Marinamargulisbacteria bacterium SCGC AAA071-K20]|nr:YebC/PmpR family DNA-binding transcriptional regulator [Candidatus Marinamargulisbacteria bacterium SCGC AAA071-K20]